MPSCAGQQRGAKVPLILDFETTYGQDPGVVAGIRMPYISESLSAEREQGVAEVMDGRRDPKRPFQGSLNVSGDITVPLDKRYIGYWFKALFGVPTTTGAGPYTHVFKIDNVNCQPSFLLEKQFEDLTQYLKFNGLKVSSMSISISGEGNDQAQVTFGLVGSDVNDSVTSYDASPTTHSFKQFNLSDSSIDEGGAGNGQFTEISLDVNAGLDESVFTIGGGGKRASIPEGRYEITGSGTILFDDMILYNKAKNATETSVVIDFVNATESLKFEMNEVEYKFTSPVVEGNQGVNLNLDFQAFYDDDAGDSAIIITLVNDITSYA